MEVLMGPSFGIEVSSSAAFVRDRAGADETNRVNPVENRRSGLGIVGVLPEDSSESSSSIGTLGDSDEEVEEGDEVSSKCDGGEKHEGKLSRGFGSVGSLEDALPIKRGLSSHFSGKSKSFVNLCEMGSSSVKDLEKPENPLNKKRRVLIASRRMRKSFYSWYNPKSMPLLPVNEEEPDPDPEPEPENDPSSCSSSDEKDQQSGQGQFDFRLQKYHEKGLGNLKFQTCFSLPDLQEQDEPS